MKKVFSLVFFLLITFSAFSQDTKMISGDTTFWFKYYKSLSQKIGLKNFMSSTDDFNFRFWDFGQVVEIQKVNNLVSGKITNYTFRQPRKNKEVRDTLFEKISIEKQSATEILSLISDSSIMFLPSDNLIKGWSQGMDGVEYIFEYANKHNYLYKKYWTPSIQDSIIEAILVQNIVNKISNILNLPEIYKTFQNKLPHKGCYNSGGMSVMCYIPNTYEIGYLGSTKLGYGYGLYANLSIIGKCTPNLGFNILHKFDNHGNYDLSLNLSKWNLIINQKNGIHDYIRYNYRLREIDFNTNHSEFQNHKLWYGINTKNAYNFGLGMDYLIDNREPLGGLFYAAKWFNKPKLSFDITTSLFRDHLDYNLGFAKSFYFRDNSSIRCTSLRLSYESFKAFKDLSIYASISF